jgi:hypothetical protein
VNSCIKCEKDSIKAICAECRILGSWYGQLRCTVDENCDELAVECWSEVLGAHRSWLMCKQHAAFYEHVRIMHEVVEL